MSKHTYKEATPKQQQEWFEEDFFMKGDFDVMIMFVVIPALVQIGAFGMMMLLFWVNSKLF